MRNRDEVNQITEWSHELFRLQVKPGGTYIDATMGNGHDTQFLCELAGETGKVLAFDIQEQALETTEKRLLEAGLRERAGLVFEQPYSYGKLCRGRNRGRDLLYFGYLPGGKHELATKADTSVLAVESGLRSF